MKLTSEELLKRVHSFTVGDWLNQRRVELVRRDSEKDSWAITGESGMRTYTKEGLWVFEPSPSNRDTEYLQRARYTLQEAFKVLGWETENK